MKWFFTGLTAVALTLSVATGRAPARDQHGPTPQYHKHQEWKSGNTGVRRDTAAYGRWRCRDWRDREPGTTRAASPQPPPDETILSDPRNHAETNRG